MGDREMQTGHLIVHSGNPYNAEPPLTRLRASLVTANADFYVRSHGNIPAIDSNGYRLKIRGKVAKPLDLSLQSLQHDFPRREVTAVLQCAGNRRKDMLKVRKVSGDPWDAGAIGNAEWCGASLGEVLRAADANQSSSLHVAFDALDDCDIEGHKLRYGVSISMSKATSPEVLLAYEMNGKPLAPRHGAPVRVVVPGFAGVRSAKWVDTITVQEHPSRNFVQAHDYQLFPPHVSEATAGKSLGITINDMPINSAICEPANYAVLTAGQVCVRGWAVASARCIERVDVSSDGGRTWAQASLQHASEGPWSWTFWELHTDLSAGEHELAVRAWDVAGQTQPASPDETWNFKGYLSSSWHRIHVEVV